MSAPDDLDDLGNTALITGKLEVDDEVRPGHLQMVVIGDGAFATHSLRDGAAHTIGRSDRCDIIIDEPSISRRHAILTVGEAITIEDVGSANGTCVRGNAIALGQPVAFEIGEVVRLGEANILLQRPPRPGRPHRLRTHDYFEARVEEECARQRRSGTAFALLRVYTDRSAAEGVIEAALAEFVRESDTLAKYGPHEYEVLLPDTAPQRADGTVRRLEKRLAERGLKGRITVACCPRDGASPYELQEKSRSNGEVLGPAGEIIVNDPQMQSLHRMLAQIAGSNISVLILGETGVGKEVFARSVHFASPRASGPFVEINCAALTETLLESELFGHEKGAFTSAVAAKPGLIEVADGGTLLLDEIGEMPLATQAKLLRVIEDSQIRRVGGLKSRSVDVRFVAATNLDLEAQIEVGAFRRDLFYRLNAVTLVIPPLRERPLELEVLARMFIARASGSGPPPVLAQAALELMRSYSWPGNIRELKNVMERALLLSAGGAIEPEHLPVEKMRATTMTSRPAVRSSQDEQLRITEALDRAGGNQTQAARLLGISRRTLVNRLNDYKDIERPRKKPRD